ncbi:MAG TPA: hypothetical protein VML75_23360 [Kofleriaceae bacterium]|nr:hypothetical protein [Kofleriaceae bacterium]
MKLRGGFVLATLIAVASCGKVTVKGDSDSGTIDAGPTDDAPPMIDAPPTDPCAGDPQVGDFISCVTTAACELLDRCACFFVDATTCESARLTLYPGIEGPYLEAYLADAMDAGILSYDAAQAGRCLDALRTTGCSTLFDSNDLFETVCQPFVGSVQANGVCFSDMECAPPGSRCEQPGCDGAACCAGSCVAPAPLGGDCTTDRLCPPGAHCVQGAANAVCTTGEDDSVCNSDSECDADHHCQANLCRPDVATDGACDRDRQCGGNDRCVGETAGASGTCRTVDSVGAACDGECLGCLYCDRPDPSQLGTCTARTELGDPCTTQSCVGVIEASCQGDTCELNGAADGQPCTGNDCRFGSFCTNEIGGGASGTCVGPQPDNSVCGYDDHCQSGICAGSTTLTCTAFADCR